MSRTYQTSSQVEAEQLATDPENRLLSHFPKRRADAEYLRDALLTISGTIDDTKGGATVKPGTNSEFGYVLYESAAECLFCRYFATKLKRCSASLIFPDPNLVQGQRTSTTLATQALYMMNHPKMLAFSEATAKRVLDLPDQTRQQRPRLVVSIRGRSITD